ncbi:ORF1 [torque teno Delphinidae virus 54]
MYPYSRRRRRWLRRRRYRFRYYPKFRRPRRYWRRRRFRRRYPVRRRRRRGPWRRRFRRWRRKVGPWAIRQWAPPVQTTCMIRGRHPAMIFTEAQMHMPFIEPLTGGLLGGSLSCIFFNLEYLYKELVAERNKWSRSNFGYGYAKFFYVKFKFYRHETFDYFVQWAQGKQAEENLQWYHLHPSKLVTAGKRKLVKANKHVNYKKRYSPVRLRLHSPPDFPVKWYTMCDMSQQLLVRLCFSLCDITNPWFEVPFSAGNKFQGFFITCGYQTPDRTTFNGYTGWLMEGEVYEKDTSELNKYPEEVRKWGIYSQRAKPYIAVAWPSWGGFTTFYYNFHTNKNYCDPFAQWTWVPKKIQYYTVTNHMTPKTQLYMSQACSLDPGKITFVASQYNFKPDYHKANPSEFVDFETNTHARTKTSTLSVYRRANEWDLAESIFPSNSEWTQGIWPGKYSPYYDTGYKNIVWGVYWASDDLATKNMKLYEQGDSGPPSRAKGSWRTVIVSQNNPYYLEFYGHNYKSYLRYINGLYPDVHNKSVNRRGFVGICITTWPSEAVKSGRFEDGTTPLIYRGWNYQYFSKEAYDRGETWTKYWPNGQSFPPMNNKNNVDYDCKICCFLADGRSVRYGGGGEGTLTTAVWADIKYATMDDIRNIGTSGPFVQNRFFDQTAAANISFSYKWKWKWGGKHRPAKWTDVIDPASFCDPACEPLPPGFPNPDTFRPPGSPCKRKPGTITKPSRRRRSAVHPDEASARYVDPDVDLDAHGMLTHEAYQRLTTFSLDTIDGGFPPPPKYGNRTAHAQWNAYRGLDVSLPPESSSSDSSDSDDTSSYTTESEEESTLWPFSRTLQPEDLQKLRRRRSSSRDTDGALQQTEEKRRRHAVSLPASPQARRHRVDHLLLQLREQRRSRRQHKHRKQCMSCTDQTSHG